MAGRTGALIVAVWLASAPGAWAAQAHASARSGACAVAPAAPLAQAFLAPPRRARPRIRYWTPQAAVNDEALRRDVDGVAAQGFGGIELVAMDRPREIPGDYGAAGAGGKDYGLLGVDGRAYVELAPPGGP